MRPDIRSMRAPRDWLRSSVMWWPMGVLACGLLGACSTMSPGECRLANWHDIGQRDGLAGQTLALLDERAKDCAEAGVALDQPRYLKGRELGLQGYCQPDNAVRLGLQGQGYQGVCPPAIDPEFRRRHALAYEVHAARSQLAGLEGQRNDLERRLREAKTDDDKRRTRNALSDLDQRFHVARDRLRQAEWQFDRGLVPGR